jgi:hypothetical protein
VQDKFRREIIISNDKLLSIFESKLHSLQGKMSKLDLNLYSSQIVTNEINNQKNYFIYILIKC